jgi:predicted nuclease of predicted toxin-antitoxin system
MKFKLDENLRVELADDLRRIGHDADTVYGEDLSGAEDAVVVAAARVSGRILMTLDKGVASLLQYPLHEHGGLVLFRPDSTGRGEVLSFVRRRLDILLQMELVGHMTVVGPARIRVR